MTAPTPEGREGDGERLEEIRERLAKLGSFIAAEEAKGYRLAPATYEQQRDILYLLAALSAEQEATRLKDAEIASLKVQLESTRAAVRAGDAVVRTADANLRAEQEAHAACREALRRVRIIDPALAAAAMATAHKSEGRDT